MTQAYRPAFKLTHAGAHEVLQAACAEALSMGVPQCISIVDEGCNLLAFLRMDGARVLSIESATRKAMTAATIGKPSQEVSSEKAMTLALATDGRMTNLMGGLPLIIQGHVVGGIGVGSGSGEQDAQVALAGVAALERAVAGAQA